MPKVGGKHFGYDPAGVAAAQAESARTGIPMEKTKSYAAGGAVPSGGKPVRGEGAVMRKKQCKMVGRK